MWTLHHQKQRFPSRFNISITIWVWQYLLNRQIKRTNTILDHKFGRRNNESNNSNTLDYIVFKLIKLKLSVMMIFLFFSPCFFNLPCFQMQEGSESLCLISFQNSYNANDDLVKNGCIPELIYIFIDDDNHLKGSFQKVLMHRKRARETERVRMKAID